MTAHDDSHRVAQRNPEQAVQQTSEAPFQEFINRLDGEQGSWWVDARRGAFARFEEHGFPTRADEDWKYTNCKPLSETRFVPAPQAVPDREFIAANSTDGAVRVILINGRFVRDLFSFDSKPGGVAIGTFEDAIAAGLPDVQELFDAPRPLESPFSFLNTAFFETGVMIQIAPGSVLEQPIEIISISTAPEGHDDSFMTLPRVLLVAGANCQATVIERHVGDTSTPHLSNVVFDARIEPGAVIDHIQVVDGSMACSQVAMRRVSVLRDASYRSKVVQFGCGLVRDDLLVRLEEKGAHCEMDGLYRPSGNQHIDNHTLIDHIAAETTSRELYKGVLDQQSRGVFHGRIIVRPDAQRINSQQTNNNLLLSDDARADSTPQLEIYADDVQCRHGSTIGRIDENMLFYLRSRGLSLEMARELLTFAFSNEIVESIKVEGLRDQLSRRLLGDDATLAVPGADGSEDKDPTESTP